MTRDERSLVVGGLVLLLGACSAGKGQSGSNEETGGSSSGGAAGTGTGGASATGTGGTAATGTGGGSAMGGVGAGAATGGAAGAGASTTGGASGSGNGGVSGAGAVPPGGDAGMGGQVACQDLTVVPTPQVPTVAIVVDNSSSMYPPDSDAFSQLYDAMMNPTTGAIPPLESKIRFGFSAFRGPERISVPETDNTCAELTTVPYALDNYDEINTVYRSVGQDGRKATGCGATPTAPNCSNTPGWETPTGHALRRIAADLGTFTADPPGRKYMLFVTDGTPNTCQVANPNCGQDLALKSMQDAHAAGIGTFVIGTGDILNTANCDPGAMRCGRDALQDMANAGAGQPVALQPMSYWYLGCATMQSGVSPGLPTATYVTSGQTPGTATYYLAMTPAELRTALTTLLTNVVSCTIQLDATVNASADPSLARVTVAGNPVPFNTADGWILETARDQITLQGAACTTFRGGAPVNVVFPCQNGRPIGM